MGTDALDNVIRFVADWVFKFGLIVAFLGGIRVAWGMHHDDPGVRVWGMAQVVAGFMVAAVAKSLSLFGL